MFIYNVCVCVCVCVCTFTCILFIYMYTVSGRGRFCCQRSWPSQLSSRSYSLQSPSSPKPPHPPPPTNSKTRKIERNTARSGAAIRFAFTPSISPSSPREGGLSRSGGGGLWSWWEAARRTRGRDGEGRRGGEEESRESNVWGGLPAFFTFPAADLNWGLFKFWVTLRRYDCGA
jgi:hypothetical protein